MKHMFITVHAAAATIIGKEIANPIIAFIAGFGLHFILDMIPHGDMKMGRKFFGVEFKTFRQEENFKAMALYGTIDGIIMAGYLIFLFRTFDFANTDGVTAAIIGGILPDIIVALYKLGNFKFLRWFDRLHHKIHYSLTSRLKDDIPLSAGIIMQVAFMAFLIWILYT